MLYVFLAVHFFSLPLIITFVAASISPFSHSRYKIFLFFFQRNWSSLVFISRSSFLCYSRQCKHWNEVLESAFVYVVLFLKGPEAMQFTAETSGCLKCKISSQLTWTRGRTYGRSPWMHRLPNFLTHGAPLRAFRARELYEEIMHEPSGQAQLAG